MVDGTGILVDPEPNFFGRHSILLNYDRIEHPIDRADYYAKVLDEMSASISLQKKQNLQTNRVLIYIHGGLNTQVSTIARAARIRKAMEIDQCCHFYTPIFINWQSSLVSSYGDHLLYIRQGKDTRKSVGLIPSMVLLSPFYLAADLAKAVGRAPIVWTMQLLNSRNIVIRWSTDMKRANDRVKERPSFYEVQRGEDNWTWFQEGGNIASGIVLLPVRLLWMPLIDALGSSSWENMLRRASVPFNPDENFRTNKFITLSTGGLTEFFNAFEDRINSMQSDVEITLVGHSMGAIIINEIIRRFPNLPIKNVVYMAAACSVRDYQDTIYPFMANRQNVQMYHLVLHELSERSERLMTQPDIVPRGSLLVWIDRFLEKPETRLDRTAGRYVNLLTADHITPTYLLNRIHIKQFDYRGEQLDKHPQKHGDFGNFMFWREAFWEPWSDTNSYGRISD